MNKFQALMGRYAPTAAVAANIASLVAPKKGSGAGTTDAYAASSPSANDLLSLQIGIDRATLRALMASNLLAAGHRTSMSIIHNIGR